MDEITRRVREMYTAYPYPPEGSGLRIDAFPRLLLSYLGAASSRPLHVLDAGCGSGESLVAMAIANPEERILGVDLNPSALALCRERIARSSAGNVDVEEHDLLAADGIAAPPGGFDIVLCSGVLHHLADPPRGLRGLTRLLAPQGVLAGMVYGRFGRSAITRLAEAIRLVRPDRDEASSRLAFGRAFVEAIGESAVTAPAIEDPLTLPDIEFVDRYLHVNERTYTVAELFELLEGAGLRFLRWLQPEEWSVRALLADGDVLEEIAALPERAQYEIVERVYVRHGLSFLACHRDAPGREPPDLLASEIAWNPQAAVTTARRWERDGETIESVEVNVRRQLAVTLPEPHAALVLCYSPGVRGGDLVATASAKTSAERALLVAAMGDLVAMEVFYLP